MSKKNLLAPKIAPLQRVIAETITDPAERAALDKAHHREKRRQREQEATNVANARASARAASKRRA